MTYRKRTLTEMSCQAPGVNDPDRLRQFEMWFAEARAAGVRVPEAMAVATATPRIEFSGLNHGASGNTNRGGKPERVAEQLRQFLSRPSRSVPASRRSTFPATWAQA